MASPVDADRVGTNGSTAATNKVCNLIGSGGGNPVSGDLLVLLLRSAGPSGESHTTPTGWTQLVLNGTDSASADVHSIWYRVADGTEGATVTVTGAVSGKFAAICWAVTGHDAATAPVISTKVQGASATPDPDSLTPAGGAQDFLWLWIGSWEGEQTSPPAGNPTNYSNPFGANSGTAGAVASNCRCAGASRQLTAASEDPPSWTISASDDWSAYTIAVYPTGGPQQFTVTATDGVYMFDGTAKIVERVLTDRIFVPDAQTRGEDVYALDKLLAADAIFAQAVRQLLTTDAVYLKDARTGETEKTIRDSALLADTATRITERVLADGLYVNDALFAQKIKDLVITDAILLNDSRVSELDKRVIDGVLMLDTVVKIIERALRDGLYLVDSVTAAVETLGQVFTVAVVDGLYLLDQALRAQEHTAQDTLLLRDDATRELLRALLDRVLLADTRVSLAELGFQDRMLVSDAASRIQEILRAEGLYIYDAVTTSLIGAVIQALVYARLRALDLLGVEFASDDLLGRRLGSADVLGRLIGWPRSRILH